MRISNPTLFNGQTLATKQQISTWLSGGADASFGTLSIPASSVIYGDRTVSAQIAAIYAKLGLSNDGENVNVIQSITNIETNLTTVSGNLNIVSGNLDELEGTVGTLSNTLVSVSSSLEDADEYISGIVDTVSGRVATAEGEIDAIQAQLAGLSQTTVVKYVEGVSGNLQDAIDTAVSGADIEITSEAGGDYAMVYTIKQGGTDVGTINIPKDQFLQSGEYIPSAEVLRLTFALPQGESNTVDIPVGALVDEYTGSSAITITDKVSGENIISLKVAAGEKYLVVTDKGLESKGIDDAIKAAVSVKADTAIVSNISGELSSAITGVASDLSTVSGDLDALEATVSTVSGDLDVLEATVSTVSGDLDALEATVSTVSDKVDTLEGNLVIVSGDLDALEATVSTVSGKVDTLEGNLATVSGKVDTLEGNLATVSGDLDALEVAVSTVSGDLDALEVAVSTISGKVDENTTAISEITLVEVDFKVDGNGDYTLAFAGKVLQVFDISGVCYPEITYDKGVATISIGEDATAANKAAAYTAIVSKKQVIVE